ncbi:MAG: hypothetical protein ACKOTB_03560, partial [Planctomycetia bacterium]
VVTVTLAVARGEISATDTPLVTVGGTPTARTLTGSPAALGNYVRQPGNLRYRSAVDDAGPRALQVAVTDGLLARSATSRIIVRPVNDAPTQNGTALLVGAERNRAFIVTPAMLRSATGAADTDSKQIAFLIDTIEGGRVERWTGRAWAAIGAESPLSTRTVAAGQRIRWIAPRDAVGATAAFSVSAWDGQRASAAVSRVSVSIAAADDDSLAYFLSGDTSQTVNTPAGYGVIGEFTADARRSLTAAGRIVGESVALKNNDSSIGYNLWPLISDLFKSRTPVAEGDRLALAKNILDCVQLYPGLSPTDEFPSAAEGAATAAGGYVFWAQDIEFFPGAALTDEVYAGVTALLWAGRQVLGDAMKIIPVPSSSLFKTLGDPSQGPSSKGPYRADHIVNGTPAVPYLASLGLKGLPTNPAQGSGGEWNFLSLLYENNLIDGFFGQQYNANQVGVISPDTLPFYSADLPYALESAHDHPSQVATGGPWTTVYNGPMPFHATVYWGDAVDRNWGQPAPANQKLKPTQAPLPTQVFGLYGRPS